jgi:putative ATPase
MPSECPICCKPVILSNINNHIDSGCKEWIADGDSPPSQTQTQTQTNGSSTTTLTQQPKKRKAADFFSTPASKRQNADFRGGLTPAAAAAGNGTTTQSLIGTKRSFDEGPGASLVTPSKPANEPPSTSTTTVTSPTMTNGTDGAQHHHDERAAKKTKTQRNAPLAERMRPRTLDDVCGQELVGPSGVLRALIESNRVPSMILWGGSGTGKTTIARCIARMADSRFVELNATSTGVAECKKLFQEAASDYALTGRKTIIFCDEIHRFNKAQQDVFLGPVESGRVTLIGATTENPSFKVVNALLSRCRTFTLKPLDTQDIVRILKRALEEEGFKTAASDSVAADVSNQDLQQEPQQQQSSPAEVTKPPAAASLLDDEMVGYLARFSDGDARTALNLLELAMSLAASRPGVTKDDIKASLTKTLVYDRGGDQHYDNISAFHKSVRGSDPDATLYYLARMLQSGEDPLFVARRMVVIASEDVGLADSSLLPLAVAAYTATQQIGMPEARIPLAHCALALCEAPKSTRAYRALSSAYSALREPGVASLPVPLHLRNAPTRLMRELGCGAEYKYPPNYLDGKVRQTYLPDELVGRRFLEDRDLGTEIDPDLEIKDT